MNRKAQSNFLLILAVIVFGILLLAWIIATYGPDLPSAATGRVTNQNTNTNTNGATTVTTTGPYGTVCTETYEPYEYTQDYPYTEPYSRQYCTTRPFRATAEYTDNGREYPMGMQFPLYDSSDNPVQTNRVFSVTNLDNQNARFGIIVTYYDQYHFPVNSYIYDRMTVYAHTTQDYPMSTTVLLNNRVMGARYFSVDLETPQYQDCQTTQNYRSVMGQQTVRSYRRVLVCQ